MFCKNCGSKLESDSLFCPNCGMKVEVSNNFNEGINNYSYNNASVNMVSVNSNYNYSKPKTTFIFVTTLIIMIIFSLRMMTISKTYTDYTTAASQYSDSYLNALVSAASVAVFFTFVSLAFSITIFVIVCNVNKKIKNNMPYKNNKLIIFSIINIVVYSIYMLSNFNHFNALKAYYQFILDTELTVDYPSVIVEVLICLTFIGFSIVNLIKSKNLKKA